MDIIQEFAENQFYLHAITSLQQEPVHLAVPDVDPRFVQASQAVESLDRVLAEPLGGFFLRHHLHSLHAVHLLTFLDEVREYRLLPSGSKFKLNMAKKIVNKYIKPRAKYELGISHYCKKRILYRIRKVTKVQNEEVEEMKAENDFDEKSDDTFDDLFDFARKEVEFDIHLSCFQSFLESRMYHRLLSLRKMEKIPVNRNSFTFIRVLGEGGFGKVSAVSKRDTKRAYACKELSKEKVIRKKRERLIMNERNILTFVKHPFIVELKYAFQDELSLYFILTLATGGELQFHLRKMESLPEEWVAFYIAELVLAIEYLHTRGIVYRDLKPENVLLDSAGHVRLTDLGLCSFIEPDELLDDHCGTKSFMAPEQTYSSYGKEVDWWSLGVMTIVLLTGHNPFYHKKKDKPQLQKSGLASLKKIGESFSNLRARAASAGSDMKTPQDRSRGMTVGNNGTIRMSIPEDNIGKLNEDEVPAELQTPVLQLQETPGTPDNQDPAGGDQKSGEDKESRKQATKALFIKTIEELEFPEMSPEAADFIRALVKMEPKERLGANGADEIKNHAFFKGIDWDRLSRKCIPPPFVPNPNSVNAEYLEAAAVPPQKSKDTKFFENFDYISPMVLQEELVETIHEDAELLNAPSNRRAR
jgi:serine/threonine protein kinase